MDHLLKPENLFDRKSRKRNEERKQKESIQEWFDAIKKSLITRPLLHRQFPDKPWGNHENTRRFNGASKTRK